MLSLEKDNATLSWLAERCVKLDRLRPETCCVMGNFYFANGDFGKALSYFSKAIQLDGCFQTAWILAGQCFVELRNYNTAISSYSQATALNPKDYRAWCGLACVYELLGMKKEAIFNYSKAISSNPSDKRLWHFLGDLYLDRKLFLEAVRCYEHCLDKYLGAAKIHLTLGQLYEEHSLCETPEQSRTKAAFHYRQGIAKPQPDAQYSLLATKALYFLAEFEITRGNYEHALAYCHEALDSSNYAQPRGKALSEKILRLMNDPSLRELSDLRL